MDFTVNAYGKPQAVPECGVHFNLSNRRAGGLLLAEGAQVGVDASHTAGPHKSPSWPTTCFLPQNKRN